MLADMIAAHESKFHSTGNASGKKYILKEKSIDIPGADEKLQYIYCRPEKGYESYYYREKIKKEKIVLHFTAGYLQGDIKALSKEDYHVSVAFVIGRNGHIYNLYSSAYWAYHLGSCDEGDNKKDSQHSVAIEISNIGPLKLVNNELHTTYGDKYCDLSDEQYYIKVPAFREYEYYAAFTEKQYKSLELLLKYLNVRYNIPLQLLPEDKRFETTQETASHKGIVSHINFRKAGKWDIGPAFDWNRISNI